MMKKNKNSIFALSIAVFMLISLACGVKTAQPLESAAPLQVPASQESVNNPEPDPEPQQAIKSVEPETNPIPVVEAKPLELISQGFGQNGQEVGYGYVINNPNPDLAFDGSQYQIAVYNAEGTVIETDSGYINFILPGQQVGIGGTIYLDEGLTAAKVEIQINEGDAVASDLSGTFTSEKVTYAPTEYYSTARGVITNPYDQEVTNLQVSAIVYDEAGEIIGGGNTYLNFILANSSTGVIIPVTSNGNVSRVEIFPILTNFYDLDTSYQLPEGASNLVLTKQGYGQANTSMGIGMILENPNQGYAIENSMYHVTSYSEDGSVLAVSDGYVNLLLPTQTLGVADAQFLDEDVIVSRVDVQIKTGDFTESNEIPAFTSENVAFLPDQYSPQVTGEIVNPYSKEISNVRVDAVAYNDAGDIIGSGMTYLDFIPANAKAAVSVYVTVVGTPAKVELYAAVSALSDLEN
jgi:hypothetical protein